MDLTEKESTESGSPEESDSPPQRVSSGGAGVVLPEPKVMMMNMAVSITSMDGSIGVVKAAAADGSGGGGIVAGSGGGDLMMVTTGSGVSGGKRKRGRPRKYDSEGNLRIPYTALGAPPPTGFTLTSPTPTSHSQFSSSSKKGRGRPAGSGNWQILASLGELLASTAGGDFTPHVVNVYAGEDVAGKILSFAQKGPRGMCILSANGTVSNVTIRQPGSSGGLLTYEGRFEILSLTGSYTVSENGGMKSRTGGLSVSLAGPDGRVIGGGVAGLLLAASPIQIVVGSFMPNSFKIMHRKRHNPEPRMTTAMPGVRNVVTEAKPLSQVSPTHHIFPTSMASQLPIETKGEADNSASSKENAHSTSTDVADYNGSGPPDERETPDINVSVAVEQP